MSQQEAEEQAIRQAAVAALRDLIGRVDRHDIADKLYDIAGANEAWAMQKELEYQIREEVAGRFRDQMNALLNIIEAFIGVARTETWKVQWLSEGREQGRKEHPDEATARAYYDSEIARVWPLTPGADGARDFRSPPSQDPWVLELRRIITVTAVIDRADSTSNWPQVAAGE